MTVRVCAWCRRTFRDGEWVREVPEPTGDVTHGLCVACYLDQERILDEEDRARYLATGLTAEDYREAEEAFECSRGTP